ncbi:unnamed protein product [Pleuronectes platessa]|uniref:V-SNARE coiled-coil homology domain-containing protein n=2 Tax=Pleuronectes platessa TaxID=8262 RepID=A0A9N7Y868_PLEPL|nr:unnamed protein product [Pleuronectes platessa]
MKLTKQQFQGLKLCVVPGQLIQAEPERGISQALASMHQSLCAKHRASDLVGKQQREPDQEEQPEATMPPKFKRHLNDDEVTGSIRSERRNLLEEDSDEEEDFFLRGPTGPRFGPQSDKIKQVQSQVDEVIDVMQENISKVIERGERLDDLQDKSESLSDNASAFSSRAKQMHRRMWWRDMKMKMIIALVVVALLLIIIIPVILRYR